MKKLISAITVVAVLLAIPGMASAKDKTGKPFDGKVTAVDTTKNTITVAKGKKESQTFNAAGAKVTVDGASSTLGNITVGMHAKVTVGSDPGTATAIDAFSHKAAGHKHKGSPTPTPTPAS